MNAIEKLEDPSERRCGCGESDLVGERFFLALQLGSGSSLGQGIDQERQRHHHQQALNPRGFGHKQGGGEEEGILEESESSLHRALSLVSGQDVLIGQFGVGNAGTEYKARLVLLSMEDLLRIGSQIGFDLPQDRLDRGIFGGSPFLGILDMFDECGVRDLMIA